VWMEIRPNVSVARGVCSYAARRGPTVGEEATQRSNVASQHKADMALALNRAPHRVRNLTHDDA
jgi:hypothetical protein